MKNIDLEEIRINYDANFLNDVQNVVYMRKNLRISQSRMAFILKCSLKTIQNFEAYKCYNYFFIFAYKEIFAKNK